MRFDMCPRGHTPDVPTRIGKTSWDAARECSDNLHDGPVTCVGAGVSQHYSSQKKRIGGRCEDAIASTSSPSDLSIPTDQVSSAERVRHTTAPGGEGRVTNEQQVDEVGGSWRPVALYSRAGSGRLCDAAR